MKMCVYVGIDECMNVDFKKEGYMEKDRKCWGKYKEFDNVDGCLEYLKEEMGGDGRGDDGYKYISIALDYNEGEYMEGDRLVGEFMRKCEFEVRTYND